MTHHHKLNILKTAIVIGATGLVGKALVNELLEHPEYSKVVVLHRRPTGLKHPKLEEHTIDFDHPESYQQWIHGDVLFSTLGTTIKQAGSQKAQYAVDFTYQFDTAEAASRNGVKRYVLVSSTSANASSRIFYARMKGELEEAVETLHFEQRDILRPSVLMGERPENRIGEKIGAVLVNTLQFIPGLKKYRGIKGSEVARAMIAASGLEATNQTRIHELEGVFDLLK